MTNVGVIADTHGLMRPEALAALQGSELILHAGDIGSPEILDALRAIAPVTAIRGNNDTQPWAKTIPERVDLQIEQVRIHMLHDLKTLQSQRADRRDVIIAGHSHRAVVEQRDDTLLINPGSAGPRRFKLPVSVALLTITGDSARARIIELPITPR